MAREYKDSGIEWIGEIPTEWNKDKLIRIFSLIGSGTTPSSSDNDAYEGDLNWIQSGDINGGDLYESKNKISEKTLAKYSALTMYDAPFIIIAMYGASVGNISISHIDGCVNQACCVMSITKQDFKYMFYAIKSAKDYLIFKAVGGGQPNISQATLKQLWLSLPPLAEQRKIADYLDKVCGEVDEMVTLQEQMIEELKAYKQSIITEAVTKGLNPAAPMKDSGIDWIGSVPEGWKVSRLKYFSNFINGFAFSSDVFSLDKGCRVIRIGDISQSLDFDGCVKANVNTDTLQPYRIKNNDIVIAMSGATTGKSCVAKNVEEAYINQRVGIIRCDNYSYVYYSLQTDYFMEYINLNNAGSAQPNVSGTSIGNFPLLVPPLDEQQAIAAYLDGKCSEIDALIAVKRQKIEALKDYKKSVIYEYVTGKKEVIGGAGA